MSVELQHIKLHGDKEEIYFVGNYFLNKLLKLIRVNVKASFARCPIKESHVISCQLVRPRTQPLWRQRESIDRSEQSNSKLPTGQM
jgi:hypothetical protein